MVQCSLVSVVDDDESVRESPQLIAVLAPDAIRTSAGTNAEERHVRSL
jgi:FixJ family two-component response regulator